MPILRIKKRDHPFVQIDKRAIEDEGLSWKAKGLLCYLLSKPDDWKIYINELKKHSTDGRDATRSALNELMECGYVLRNRLHGDNGKFQGFEYLVLESPFTDPQSICGLSVNGSPVNGLSENGKSVTTNNNKTNNNSNNIESRRAPRHTQGEIENQRPHNIQVPVNSKEGEDAARNNGNISLRDRMKAAHTPTDLLSIWNDYLQMIEISLTEPSQELMLDQFERWGIELSKENIRIAIQNGYKGLKNYAV